MILNAKSQDALTRDLLGYDPDPDPARVINSTVWHDDGDYTVAASTEYSDNDGTWQAASRADHWLILGIPAGIWLAAIVIGALAVRYWGDVR